MRFTSAFHQEGPGGAYRTVGADREGRIWVLLPGAEPAEFTPGAAARFGAEMTRLAMLAGATAYGAATLAGTLTDGDANLTASLTDGPGEGRPGILAVPLWPSPAGPDGEP